MRVLVVGAGVIGLTCAVAVAERGHQVDVIARDLPQETTSAVAGAWWYPYLAFPRERVFGWSKRSLEVFDALAAEDDSGVVRRHSREFVRASAGEPWWAEAVASFRPLTDVPPGYAGGWEFDGVVASMPHYLEHLVARLQAAGGTLTRLALGALPPGGDVVINASGLGSRLLAADPTTTPVRGQRLRLPRIEGIDEVVLDQSGPEVTYVIPRIDDTVVGGTSEPGAWDLGSRVEDSEAMLARAVALVPALAGAQVLETRVGLRPARPTVRLKVEERPASSPVVHCYGHGGAGVTLSWGCADEVAELVDAL